MKNTVYSLFIVFILFLVSCKEEDSKPKVSYDLSEKTPAIKTELPKILLADLPIQMQGTTVLLHPIGAFSVSEGVSKSKYAEAESENFTISNYSENEIAGYISNIKFQQIGSDSLKMLTEKPILIERITYLKSIADNTKNQILVYIVSDMDTNKDEKLDSNDIKSLYLSKIDGTSFTKISEELMELIDWNIVESNNRLYFRSVEDTNKNGEFDNNDIIHYHYIDLTESEWKVQNYSPI